MKNDFFLESIDMKNGFDAKTKSQKSHFAWKMIFSRPINIRAALHQQNLCCVLVFLESQIYVC